MGEKTKMKPWKTDFGFVQADTPESLKSQCRICNELIESGAFVCFSTPSNSYYKSGFRVHPDCLIRTGEEAKKVDWGSYVDPRVEKKRKRKADLKVCSEKVAEIRKKAEFNKSLIKEALKKENLKISKIKITRNEWRKVTHGVASLCTNGFRSFDVGGRVVNGEEIPGVILIFSGSEVVVRPSLNLHYAWNQSLYPKGAEEQVIQLADPDALVKLGKAIMSFDKGYFSQFRKS